MRGVSVWALVLFVPVGVRAQDEEAPPSEAPASEAPPDVIFMEPSQDLDAPTGPVTAPQGYGDLTLPDVRPRSAPRRRVRIEVLGWGDRPLTLHLRPLDTGEPLTDHCTAPCQLDLEPGRYQFAVQPRGASPRRADDQPIWISGGHTAIQMSYDHRVGLRSLGWTLLMTGLSGFAVSWYGGIIGALIGGLPVAIAFMIPAIPLIFLEDSARVQVDALPD